MNSIYGSSQRYPEWIPYIPGSPLFWFLVLSLSFFCLIHLWFVRKNKISAKLLWSIILLLPLLGPIFFLALSSPPSSRFGEGEEKEEESGEFKN